MKRPITQTPTLRPTDIESFRRTIQFIELNYSQHFNSHVRGELVAMDAHFRRLHTAHRKTMAARRLGKGRRG
jgi:hypothetical protein